MLYVVHHSNLDGTSLICRRPLQFHHKKVRWMDRSSLYPIQDYQSSTDPIHEHSVLLLFVHQFPC